MWSKGFTLVELIITVGLVALLSVGVVSLLGRGQQQYGRDARRQADLNSMASALEVYRTDNGSYPGTVGWIPTMMAGGYLRVGPTDPAGGGRAYAYSAYYFDTSGNPQNCNVAPTRCPSFALCAAGEKATGGTPTPVSTGFPACGSGSCGTGFNCSYKVTNP